MGLHSLQLQFLHGISITWIENIYDWLVSCNRPSGRASILSRTIPVLAIRDSFSTSICSSIVVFSFLALTSFCGFSSILYYNEEKFTYEISVGCSASRPHYYFWLGLTSRCLQPIVVWLHLLQVFYACDVWGPVICCLIARPLCPLSNKPASPALRIPNTCFITILGEVNKSMLCIWISYAIAQHQH